MPNITRLASVRPNIHPAAPGALKADLATAHTLKAGIKDVLMRVRFGAPLAAKDLPKQDREGNWNAPNGDLLIKVQLSGKPPAGSADFASSYALVDPKTNKFFSMQSGGITGMTLGYGPLSLPAELKFKGKHFGQLEVQQLTRAANRDVAAKLPSRRAIETAIGAYAFHKMIKYGARGPKDSEVAGRVALTSDKFPDGFHYTALVLKSDPNKVVIMKSGGFAGITQYSNPLDTSRLPK